MPLSLGWTRYNNLPFTFKKGFLDMPHTLQPLEMSLK